MIDGSFQFWTDVISLVVNLILSNPITASFFGTFVILVISNVIYQIYSRKKESQPK